LIFIEIEKEKKRKIRILLFTKELVVPTRWFFLENNTETIEGTNISSAIDSILEC